MSSRNDRGAELHVRLAIDGRERELRIAAVDSVLNRDEGDDEEDQRNREHGFIGIAAERMKPSAQQLKGLLRTSAP